MQTIGKRLVSELKTGAILKDLPPEYNQIDFHAGYEDLYLFKFKTWLSSVSRYILIKLKESVH